MLDKNRVEDALEWANWWGSVIRNPSGPLANMVHISVLAAALRESQEQVRAAEEVINAANRDELEGFQISGNLSGLIEDFRSRYPASGVEKQ